MMDEHDFLIFDLFLSERCYFDSFFTFMFEMTAVGLYDVVNDLFWCAVGIFNFEKITVYELFCTLQAGIFD